MQQETHNYFLLSDTWKASYQPLLSWRGEGRNQVMISEPEKKGLLRDPANSLQPRATSQTILENYSSPLREPKRRFTCTRVNVFMFYLIKLKLK